jgi:hypothetical protein
MRIKIITESLSDKVRSGKMPLREAAVKLYNAGWTNYIDIESTRKLLEL